MPLPSISHLAGSARHALVRFPVVLLAGAILAATCARLSHAQSMFDPWVRLVLAAGLGIPLLTAARLFAERVPQRRWRWRVPWSTLLAAGAVVLLGVAWWGFGREPGHSRYIRFAQLALAAHLAVAFAPFATTAGRRQVNAFWQFNRRLLLRFLLSSLYSGALFGGLALALLAVHHLFAVPVGRKVYFDLFFVAAFVLHPWHFLAGVPHDLPDLERDRSYPKALRTFCQFVLLPLLALYFAILYAYAAKILLSHEWPQGFVGWLVSSASVFGVLTILLLHPTRDTREGNWVAPLSTGFYAAVLPLLGLLYTALGKRVGQYGITERRYLLGVLGLWLGGTAIYMLVSRAKSIMIIPITLAVVALGTAGGPWGASQVSRADQSGKLDALLARHGLLAPTGRLQPAMPPHEIPRNDEYDISRLVEYLVDTHGAAALNRWSREQRAAVEPPQQRQQFTRSVEDSVMAEMGLRYLPR